MQFLFDMTWIDWVGVFGSILISVAYFMVSFKKLEGDSVPFQILNLVGACLILASLIYRPNAGAILIEVLWIAIAIWSLGRAWFSSR